MVRNIDAFYDAFDVTDGDDLYLEPDNASASGEHPATVSPTSDHTGRERTTSWTHHGRNHDRRGVARRRRTAALCAPEKFESFTATAFPDDTRTWVLRHGAVETGLGIGLLIPATRKLALAGLVAYGAHLGFHALPHAGVLQLSAVSTRVRLLGG